MVKNAETAADGTEVYTHRVFSLADEYIQQQLNGDAEKAAEYFRDMIFYMSDRMDRPDNSDIEALDSIFNAYVRLCARYKVLPTLECFSFLVKINRATFTDWSNGEYRASTGHGNTVKKWLNICKGFVVDSLTNTRGTDANRIFIAKAAYGMRETAPVPAAEPERRRVLTAEELPRLDELEEKALQRDAAALPKLGELSGEQQ